jgi:hypothetical protein
MINHILESHYYLLDRFTWNKEDKEFQSKNTWKDTPLDEEHRLIIYTSQVGTIIYWRDMQGFEQTLFDGRALSQDEMENMFELIEINKYLKWKN